MVNEKLHTIAREIARDLGRPDLAKASLLNQNGEWWRVFLEIPEEDPASFKTAAEYFSHAQCRKLFAKFTDFPGATSNRESAALKIWYRDESLCWSTNRRFYGYRMRDATWWQLHPRVREFLTLMKKYVRKTLGSAPDVHDLPARFGPGATFESRGVFTSVIPSKISGFPTYTWNAVPFLWPFRLTAWGRYHARLGSLPPSPVKGNRWSSVPKDWTRDRSIGVEPALNIFYQLGVGEIMKRRLRQVGLLLKPYEDWLGRSTGLLSEKLHREMARLGSIYGELATIDLTSASDTVAQELVDFMLPLAWRILLNSLRSPFTRVGDDWIRLEKHSSMGNGYTFELETLLFSCACRAVAELEGVALTSSNFSVYGDDIVAPTALYNPICSALRFLGFQPNLSKSFDAGPFRESCGGDYFRGEFVRPIFIRSTPTEPSHWYALHNQIAGCWWLSELCRNRLCRMIANEIPVILRNYGPSKFGDAVLHGPEGLWNTRVQKTRDDRGQRGDPLPHIRVLRTIPSTVPLSRWDDEAAFAAMLAGSSSLGVQPRGLVEGYRNIWIPA